MRRLLFFLTLLWTANVAAQGIPKVSEGTCKQLTLAAQEMNCVGKECALEGEVELRCEKLKLWADKVVITLDDKGGFAGAQAQGNVMLVEGNRLTTCNSLTVGPDKIQTRIEDAVVQVKAGPDKMPVSGVPIGKNQSTFTGDIERISDKELRVTNATFTLCDCGTELPSWRFEAREIEATLGRRVTLWWPMFYINPFGLGMVPITPPLLPISLPLNKRALGLLPPSIRFLQSPWPMIDLPVFVPLGDSYDITVSPGLRMDWVQNHKLTPVERWGAPRLGGRFRYAPAAGTAGELDLSWTHDGLHGAARKVSETPKTDPRYNLLNRVALAGNHHSVFFPDLRLDIDASWVSDDLYLNDFGTSVASRTADYLPSRAQLALTLPSFAAQAAADYYMVINNGQIGTGLLNRSIREYQTPERGPFTRLHLAPVAIARGLHADADASVVRYGAWEKGIAPMQVLTGGAMGLSYLNRLGPLSLSARAALDALYVDAQGQDPFTTSILLTRAEAFLTLRRRFRSYTHTITPRLVAQALPWRDGPVLYQNETTPVTSPVVPFVDERLRRSQTLYQGMLVVDQTLKNHTKSGLLDRATFTISQPLDLQGLVLYPTRANLSAALKNGFNASAYATYYAQDGEWRELGGNANAPIGPLRLTTNYKRWTPRAGRFLRTIYELEAPPNRTIANLLFVHSIAGSVTLNLFDRVQLAYNTTYYLPVPKSAPAGSPAPGFLNQGFGVSYTSACGVQCWGVSLTGDVQVRDVEFDTFGDFWAQVNFQITPNIGGFSVQTR